MMTWIMLYYDALEDYKLLSDEQFGRLVREALRFAKTGEETKLPEPESYLWPGLRNRLLRDKESYMEKCRKNAENINKRWEQQRETGQAKEHPDAYESIRSNTNEYERYEEKEEVKEESEEKEKNKVESESEVKSEENARRMLRAEGYADGEMDRALSRVRDRESIRSLRAYLKKAIDDERMSKRVPAQDYPQRDYSGEDEEARQRMIEQMLSEKEAGKL